MAVDPIASRYAEALLTAVKPERAVRETLEPLLAIRHAFDAQPEVAQLLRTPAIAPSDKVAVLDRVLQGAWPSTVRAFVQMVIELGRAELLPQIIEAFAEAVDVEEGCLRVTVRSARPLAEPILTRLQASVEQREHQRAVLTMELAPALLGGVQIQIGHRLIDGSVRRQLEELRHRLRTVHVA